MPSKDRGIPAREGARARSDRPAGVALRPQGPEGPAGEGERAARRRARCQGRQVHAAHCGAGLPPPPAPSAGRDGVSGDVTGGDYSLERAVVRLPLTGRAAGGRLLRGDRPELRCQLRARAPCTRVVAPRAPRGKVRLNFAAGPDARSLPLPSRSWEAAASEAAAPAQPGSPGRSAGGHSDEGQRRARVGASARASRGRRPGPAPRSAGTSRAAGARRSPPGSRGSALALEGAGTSGA